MAQPMTGRPCTRPAANIEVDLPARLRSLRRGYARIDQSEEEAGSDQGQGLSPEVKAATNHLSCSYLVLFFVYYRKEYSVAAPDMQGAFVN